MHYMSKHAAAKKISVKQRIAGVGIAGAATIVVGRHGRVGQGRLGLGSRRPVRVGRQLAHQHRERLLRRPPVPPATWRGFGGTGTPRGPTSPPGRADRHRAEVLDSRAPAPGPCARSGPASRGPTVAPPRRRGLASTRGPGDDEEGRQEEVVATKPTVKTPGRAPRSPCTVATPSASRRALPRAGGWKALWKANDGPRHQPEPHLRGSDLRLP